MESGEELWDGMLGKEEKSLYGGSGMMKRSPKVIEDIYIFLVMG